MSIGPLEPSDVVRLTVGAGAGTSPFWSDVVAAMTGLNQALLAIGGLIIVALTIRNLWLKNRILEQQRKDPDNG